MSRPWLLVALLIVPGIFGVCFFGYYTLLGYAALRVAYANFERVAQASPSVQALLVAEAKQNVHRINVFADGTWTLLSAVIAAIGVHGWCVSRPSTPAK